MTQPRILIVDDEPAMHDSYRRSFALQDTGDLDAMAAELWEDANAAAQVPPIGLTHVYQGLEAVAEVEQARTDGVPFAVAFIDIRMPPGIDGRETARRIRALDPNISIVIVTGYSDFSPLEISKAAGPVEKIFYIVKPFDVAEIQQTAAALIARWQHDRELARARAAMARQLEQLKVQAAELAANESRAIHIATHDSLTEAPNRLAFTRALAERTRQPGMFACAVVDLDRFKLVNDTLGHLAGDELLREICAMLHQAAPTDALIARLGGDEFGVLFDTPGEDAACMCCEKLVAACSTMMTVFGHPVQSSASAGLAVAEGGDDHDAVDIARRADLALNHAKRMGRGVVRRFDASMDEGVRFRRRIENGLGEAIARGELTIAYQPIVTRDQLDIEGFEALLRWNTTDYGPISPSTFIPIAEESNLIHDLGDWVLHAALEEVKRWPDQYVSINFSPRQFRRPNFIGAIVECVARAGVAPNRLQIEITERAIFDDAERASETLYRLRQMGFRIAIDDFGTGYSSLYNIRKFALDCLKIDRSFIDGMGRERESAAIVHSIIHLGRSLGLGIVAEGVETEAQAQALRLAGASHLQGYYFSHPVTPEAAREMAVGGLLASASEEDEAEPGTGTHG